MKYLVANKEKALVIEAESDHIAIAAGMLALGEDSEDGNVMGVPIEESLFEMERKLIIGGGDFFEHMGYMPQEYNVLLECVRKAQANNTFL